MKRFLLFFYLLFFSFVSNAQKTWNGSFSNLWNDGANWSPAGVPATSDDVLININTEIFLNGATTIYQINSIRITGNVTVTLQCAGSIREVRLASTSVAIPGLLIDAGSTLAFRGYTGMGLNNSSLDLTYGAGVVGSIYGTLIIKNPPSVAPSTPGVHLITSRSPANPSFYGIVTVYFGGTIKIDTSGGNTISALTPVPTLVMKDGSTYENKINGGTFPVGTWETNSLAKETGMTTLNPVFSASVYGNLEWNCPAQSSSGLSASVSFNNVNFITTASVAFGIKNGAGVGKDTMIINGNLDISSSTVLIQMVGLTSSAGSVGKIILKGYLNNQGGTISTLGPAGTTSELEFNGSSNQNITNTGTISGAAFGTVTGLTFIMNNPAGATLLTPLTIPAKLVLSSGKISTTASNILRMADGGSCPGGGTSTSFVNGPMKKIGRDNFIFPIGTGSIYAPIGITNVSAPVITDTFAAEYLRVNPQGVHGTNYQSPINHISYVEYWTLDRSITSTATKNVSLAVNFTSFCYDLSKTYVSRFDGLQWTFEASGYVPSGSSFPYVSGTITSATTISTFSPAPNAFTLSTDLPFNANPLPINLITFNAIKLTNTKASTNWELANYCSDAAKFEVQREDINKHFVTVGIAGGSETNRFYNFIDNDLKNGINYYRLKMIDENGKISYSRTVAVMNGVNGLLLTSLLPTMVTNSAMLTVASSGQQKVNLIITDMQGRVVQKQEHTIAAGNTNIQIATDRLAAGVYQLMGITAEGKTNVIRFIKQ